MEHMNASWPTWMVLPQGGFCFLTDEQCKERQIPYDAAPRQPTLKRAAGHDLNILNGFPVPKPMAAAIQKGECREIMLADGNYEEVHVDEDGHLHNDKGPALICTPKHSLRVWPQRVKEGQKMALWYEHGVGGKMEVLEASFFPRPN